MHAIRKSDLKAFAPRSEDVCRIADGSTNTYPQPERVVEDFPLSVEPRYNAALNMLRDGEPDAAAVHAIAGFAAYVSTCTPAAIRIPGFVSKNRHYRVQCVTTRIPYGTGIMHVATQRVVATGKAA